MTKSIALCGAVLLLSVLAFCSISQAKDQSAAEAAGQAGINQAPQQAGTDTGQTAVKAGERIEARGQEMNDAQADEKWLKMASSGNEFEIQAAQYIEQNVKNPDVKQLAQAVIHDHQQAQQNLQQVAQQMKIQLPSNLMPAEQAKLQQLEKQRGKELDLAYAFDMVGDHQMDILWYQWAAEHAKDQQLKDYAQQTIPVLEHHLRLAEAATAQWVPQARTAGERIPGQRSREGVPGASDTNGGSNAAGGAAGTGTNNVKR